MNPKNQSSLFRAVDANINRTCEALRVIEDIFRFIRDDRFAAAQCKSLRHEVVQWTRRFDSDDLLRARDVSGDVGRRSDQASEYHRANVVEILKANFSRAQQSLRVLEEMAKLQDRDAAKHVESIRYRVYELEQSTLQPLSAIDLQNQIDTARLYVLVDSGENNPQEFFDRIRNLCQLGVDIVQLRDKSLGDRQLMEFGDLLVQATRDSDTLAIINDRVDIAMLVNADGVHIGQDDLSLQQVRSLVNTKMLVGVSTHSIEQAISASESGADYIGVGPTFPSTTKSFSEFTGTSLLRKVASKINIPAFAIGGIRLKNVDDVIQAGICRVAVSAAAKGDAQLVATQIQGLKMRLTGVTSNEASSANEPTSGTT